MGIIMQMFISIVLVIVFISLFTIYFKLNCYKKLDVSLSFDKDRTKENDYINLIVEMKNRKLLIIPIIKVNIKIPKSITIVENDIIKDFEVDDYYTYSVVTSLLFFQKAKKCIKLQPLKRGHYTIFATATLIDSLGIYKLDIPVYDTPEIIVHPSQSGYDNCINKSISMMGEKFVRRWIMPDPIFYSGVRPYDFNDSFKDIDWKATAKLGELYVKKYDYTQDPSLMIFMDVFSNIDGKPCDNNFIEIGIRYAAMLVDLAYRNKIPVGFGTNSYMKYHVKNIVAPDNSLSNIIAINDMLACMEYKCFDTFKNTMDMHIKGFTSSSIIVFIKYEMTGYLYKTIKFLSSQNKKAVVVLFNKNDLDLHDRNVEIIYLS